jgi:hypothetical protein
VALGGTAGFQFEDDGRTAVSLSGSETWQVFEPRGADNHAVLVRRPGGEWRLFLPDGRELHFGTACDACGDPGLDPHCRDPLLGGKARLVKYVDARGSGVSVSYDRPGGLLLGLADDLGHALELRGEDACGTAPASTPTS